jgi:hypothetical protein
MKVLILLVVALISGCSGMGKSGVDRLKSYSSGSIGCPPQLITISEDSGFWDSGKVRTWAATCEDEKYYCSVSEKIPMCKKAK